MEESRREDRIFSALEDNVFFLRQRGAKRAKARNPNNPIQATQLRSVGLVMRVRGCVPEARHYSTRP